MDGHVRADDDVRAHRLGDIDGIVVPHAAVQQHFAVLAHGPEVERDGHRGTEGVGDVAGGPVLGSQGVEVRRDAGVGDRKVGKADAVLIAHGHGTEHVAYVETVQEAVGHAETHAGDGLVEHVGRVVAGLRRHLVGDPFVLEAVHQVLVIVMVRESDGVGLAIFADFVADILGRDIIGHHDGPLDGTHQRIQLVMLVTQGIQATHEAAHAGTRDDVHGDAQFFHILNNSQVREAAGAAAGQDQAHRRPVLADGVHACAHFRERGGIHLRMGTLQDRFEILRHGTSCERAGGEQSGNQLFHRFVCGFS